MARSFSSPAAFRQALERRLKTTAEERNVPLNTLRLKFVIERLLARLFARPNPPWLLKGGYAMELRYRPHARTTKDIDLSVGADEQDVDLKVRLDRIRDELQVAADVDLGDYLTFRIATPRTELLGAPQGGARFPVEALMAGRVFGGFHIDVGIGDALHGEPERLHGEDLLAFAGIAPAQALAIPKAQQFAEKIHAYTYPWTGRRNTRTRDLVDLLLLLERQPPDSDDIRASIAVTFTTRGTHPVPETLQEPPAGWATEFAEMATQVQLETNDLNEAFQRLSASWNAHRFAGAG
ncbi:MAG: nucleotidyl transferase AbiEii/AbiGii toxin family protein [Phycisphaerae bacterium]|nr:nucleotidyl transferase AbiEii/AbiGii toxin family protein [Phycisphaerae bacterium]